MVNEGWNEIKVQPHIESERFECLFLHNYYMKCFQDS